MSTGSSSQTPVTTTQTNTPWSGAQTGLSQAINEAMNLQANQEGYQPYTGGTQAPLNQQLQTGLDYQWALAAAEPWGTSTINAARGLGQTMLENQGLTSGQQAMLGNLNTVYNQASDQQNPYLQAEIDAQNRIIADKVNSTMSGAGRYGSGAHTDVLARSLAEAADPILAQDYTQRQQQRLQALGQQQAAYAQGSQNAGQWAQEMPTLDAARYANAAAMQQTGQFYQDRAQQDLAAQIQLYNAQQSYQWEQLQRLNAVAAGAGALGGTKVTAATPYQAPLTQRLLGGSIAGGSLGSIFGPIGTGIGALGGGLLGGFG